MVSVQNFVVYPNPVMPGVQVTGEITFTLDDPMQVEVSGFIDGVGGGGGTGPRDAGTHVVPFSISLPRSTPPGIYTFRTSVRAPSRDFLGERTQALTVTPLPRRHDKLVEDISLNAPDRLDDLYVAFSRTLLGRSYTDVSIGDELDPAASGTSLALASQPLIQDEYQRLIGRRDLERLLEFDEIDACVFAHWKLGVVRYPPHSQMTVPDDEESAYEQIKHIVLRQLANPLIYATEEAGTFELTTDQILEAYRFHREEWASEQAHFEIVAPLLNFTMDADHEVRLSAQLRLSPFHEEEKTHLRESGRYTVGLPPLDAAECKLTYDHNMDAARPYMPTQEVQSEIEDWLTALRLFKAGEVSAPLMFDQSKVRSVWLPSTTVLVDSALGASYWFIGKRGQHYHLHTDELPTVIDLFTTITQLQRPKRKGLGTAFRRFNLAYARDHPEDAIVDLAIAFESSLVTGETTELTYKMAMRGAALLAGVRNPEETAKILKSFYGMRSQIVHEGKLIAELAKYARVIDPSGGPLEVVQRCLNLARDVLKQYLRFLGSNTSVAKINDQLESSIVRGLTPWDAGKS